MSRVTISVSGEFARGRGYKGCWSKHTSTLLPGVLSAVLAEIVARLLSDQCGSLFWLLFIATSNAVARYAQHTDGCFVLELSFLALSAVFHARVQRASVMPFLCFL